MENSPFINLRLKNHYDPVLVRKNSMNSVKMDTKICRICLNEKASISVFDKQNDNIQYCAKIMRCVSVIITVDDDLPKMICEECVQELDTAFRFVERCEATDRALRNFPISHNVSITVPITYHPTDDVKHEPDDHIYDEQFLLEDFKTDPQEFHSQDLNDQPEVLNEQVKESEPKRKSKPKKMKRGKNGPIRCVICSYIASCRSAMETHMRSHTGEKPYPCNICHQKFTTNGGRKRHMVNNHSERERRFTCETCGNSFFSKADIITHMRIHTDEKPYVCPECSKQFRQIASLIRHKRIHTGEKPFPCPVCGKCFADKNLVKKHQLVHSDERKFMCHLCSKSMKSRTALKTHMDLHSNEKNNVCSFCGQAFSMKGNLKIHIMRMHSEKSGQCSVCAITVPNLEDHMRKHTGERPFVCPACGQTYSTKRSLTHHIMFKHANADKYKCSVGECTRSFPTALMLEYHLLKQHTNHTPFVCPHCARGFYRNSDLSRHLKVTHVK